MIYASIGAFAMLFVLFLAAWRRYGTTTAVTPLVVFAAFEVVGVWPSSVYAQSIGMSNAYVSTLLVFAFASFLATFALICGLTRTNRNVVEQFVQSPVILEGSEKAYLIVTIFFGVLLVALGTYLYGPTSLLLEALEGFGRGDSQTEVVTLLSTRREEITKGYYFGEAYRGQGLILQILQTGWPFLTLMAAVIAHSTRRLRWFAVTGLLLLLSFNYVGAAARFQLVSVLLIQLIGMSLLTKLNLRRLIFGMAAMIVTIVAVAPLSVQTAGIDLTDNPVGALALSMRDRILFGDGIHNIEVIEFTEAGWLPYGFGQYHIEKAMTALPGVTWGIPLSQQLQSIRTGDPNDTAFASMTYFGVLYADFGPFGPIIGYAAIGFFVAFLQARMFRMPKTVFHVPLIASATLAVGNMTIGSSVSALATLVVVIAFHYSVVAVFRRIQGAPRAPAVRHSEALVGWRARPQRIEGFR
jgi:hypothetical protein